MPGLAVSGDGSVLVQALSKLIDVIEDENAVLARNELTSHSGFTDRKNHALRDLMAAQRGCGSSHVPDGARPLLRRLSTALQENARLLRLHITAVGEVSDIIIASLREAESDGTYARVPSRRGA